MSTVMGERFRYRRNFGKIRTVLEIPNLIEVQKRSYEEFLQPDASKERREPRGLQSVFQSVFPIRDFNEKAELEFVSYELGEPKYDVSECLQRGMTFAAPMKVTIQLIVYDRDEMAGQPSIRNVKEQEVYFGEIPLMTDKGTFIVNGTERVIVSQLHRSPGVFFDHDKGKTHSSGKLLYSARIIPYRGSWIDFEFDHKDVLYVRIDRRRKMFATTLLKALGYSPKQLMDRFYKRIRIDVVDGEFRKTFDPEILLGQVVTRAVRSPKTDEVLVKKGQKLSAVRIRRLVEEKVKWIPLDAEDVHGAVVADDIAIPAGKEGEGEILAESNAQITPEALERMVAAGITSFDIYHVESSTIRETLLLDRSPTTQVQIDAQTRDRYPVLWLEGGPTPEQLHAIIDIYKRLRPGDPPTVDTAVQQFYHLFLNPDRYDLSKVGRLKLNYKLSRDLEIDDTILYREDILAVIEYLLKLRSGKPDAEIDDIDHLGNRRVRSVGELLENQYRIGLARMERAIKERMSLQEIETLMPHDLINAKPVTAVVKEFFGSSQLSQFMDQTNPLSEITHKRRLSALGPGGLTRERAGFEVRDVHPTHYGRICPIETPEGPNIGLIASLSTFARVNDYGFIETPYRKVGSGRVSEEIQYLSALEERDHGVAQANAPLDKAGRFQGEFVGARRGGESTMMKADEVSFMDVSPMQLVSVAASLIPFLEHDDANRALMGSNMQRQAVPLLRTEAPLVGTGIEGVVARDSGVTTVAKRSGVVENVDASRIVIRVDGRGDDSGVDIYNLLKFQRSNQNTCINQKPIVAQGERVEAGHVIADGPATDRGELALGRNVLVAFMPWGGYNFEDSILVSERLIKKDYFTSVHIEQFECMSRDTKLGKEEITRDIPNVGEEALRNLDESGIVRIGAHVKTDDILVGKITPKGETQLTPEEKLLRAIFGEKAEDVRDTSLRVPPGIEGIVIDAKVFSRKGAEKDERSRDIEDREVAKLRKDQREEVKVVRESANRRIRKTLVGKISAADVLDTTGKPIVEKGDKFDEEVLAKIPYSQWESIAIADGARVEDKIRSILQETNERIEMIKVVFEDKIQKLKKGDDLPPGVIKLVKVYIAIKRRLSVGDKMAGRHGNKGVVSNLLPEEDMPFLSDGTAVDIVLNPLGVPSRMNVGQILETHLGWAARGLGERIQEYLERDYSPEALRKKITQVYASKDLAHLLEGADDDAVLNVARSLVRGVHMSTPVFDGAEEPSIRELMEQAGLPQSGQTILFDGRTGDAFRERVTVGVMYMLKLHHLVDDKIHARSIGPYSLVTQQPLGGKAQFGGQRLGEMEVWAMEAYGAAYGLQEFLTVKSDDVPGRTRIYESIVRGQNSLEPGLPESFNVLMKELQSLALDVELREEETV